MGFLRWVQPTIAGPRRHLAHRAPARLDADQGGTSPDRFNGDSSGGTPWQRLAA